MFERRGTKARRRRTARSRRNGGRVRGFRFPRGTAIDRRALFSDSSPGGRISRRGADERVSPVRLGPPTWLGGLRALSSRESRPKVPLPGRQTRHDSTLKARLGARLVNERAHGAQVTRSTLLTKATVRRPTGKDVLHVKLTEEREPAPSVLV